MSRGGSFDQSGAGLELYVGWRKRNEVGLSNTDLIQEVHGTHKRQSAQLPGTEPGPHNGVGPSGVGKAQSAKASYGTDVVSIVAPPRCPVEISPATRSIC